MKDEGGIEMENKVSRMMNVRKKKPVKPITVVIYIGLALMDVECVL